MDFAGSGIVAARNVGDVDEADGIDIFDEELDAVFRGDFAAALEGFDAIGVHFISRETVNGVARLHDEASAFEFAHGGNKFAERFEEDFASGGVGQGLPDAGGAVEFDAEFAFLAASVGKILLFPVLEFSDQLDGVVARFGYFFQALFEWKIAVDSPKHYGERERNALGFGGSRRGARHRRWAGSGTGQSRCGTRADKFASSHAILPKVPGGHSSRRRPRARRPLLRAESGLHFRC